MKSNDPGALSAIFEGVFLNPIPFLVAIAVIAVALYYGFEKLWYGPRISTQDATIINLKTQVEDYKEKLKGRTPEQAAAQIAELEKQALETQATLRQTSEDLSKTKLQLRETSGRLDNIVNPPRDRTSVYINGVKVGKSSSEPRILPDGSAHVAAIDCEEYIDKGHYIEIGTDSFIIISFQSATTRRLGMDTRYSLVSVSLSPSVNPNAP